MKIVGTKFKVRVWNEIKKIPKGETVSYRYITKKIGKPLAYRAVANVCSKNPHPIIIPCHRVIKQNGETEGYFKQKDSIEKKILLEQELT